MPMGIGVSAERQGVDSSHVSRPGLYEVQRCPHLVLTDEPGGTACAAWQHRDAGLRDMVVSVRAGPRLGRGSGLSLRYLLRGIEHALAAVVLH